ncbi:hypothetical protein ACUIJ5_00275 [Bacillus toyonensis]
MQKRIEENQKVLKGKVLEDPYLNYLIKAIYHVTEPPKGGEV